MRTPVLVTTDFTTTEEVGASLGVSPSRVKHLIEMADEAVRRTLQSKTSSTRSRNAAATRTRKTRKPEPVDPNPADGLALNDVFLNSPATIASATYCWPVSPDSQHSV